MRREYLDHVLFWNAPDLERKLADFTTYGNAARSRASLAGNTPMGIVAGQPAAQFWTRSDHRPSKPRVVG